LEKKKHKKEKKGTVHGEKSSGEIIEMEQTAKKKDKPGRASLVEVGKRPSKRCRRLKLAKKESKLARKKRIPEERAKAPNTTNHI